MTLVNSAAICVPDNFLLAVAGNLAMVETKWSKPTVTESIELSTFTLNRFFSSSILFLPLYKEGAAAPTALGVVADCVLVVSKIDKLLEIALAALVEGSSAVTTMPVPAPSKEALYMLEKLLLAFNLVTKLLMESVDSLVIVISFDPVPNTAL